MNVEAQTEMPKYQCHKKVWALKIANIKRLVEKASDPMAETAYAGAIITPEDAGYGPFEVDADYVRKHAPKAGGYYVVYADGYKSWSPADAFEDGYTRI